MEQTVHISLNVCVVCRRNAKLTNSRRGRDLMSSEKRLPVKDKYSLWDNLRAIVCVDSHMSEITVVRILGLRSFGLRFICVVNATL